jgi:hypothetical protein
MIELSLHDTSHAGLHDAQVESRVRRSDDGSHDIYRWKAQGTARGEPQRSL